MHAPLAVGLAGEMAFGLAFGDDGLVGWMFRGFFCDVCFEFGEGSSWVDRREEQAAWMARRGHPDEIDVSGDFSAVEQEGGRCNSGVPVWGARVWSLRNRDFGQSSWHVLVSSRRFYPEKQHLSCCCVSPSDDGGR